MAVKTIEPCRHISTHGKAPELDFFSVTGSTHKANDLCVRTNNCIAACSATTPSPITALALTAAANTVPGSTAGTQPLIKITSDDEFEMNVYHATPGSALIADADIDDAKQYGITFATVSGVSAWVIDLAESTSVRVSLVKRLDAATDTYPRCVVRFLPSVLTFN